MIDKMKECAAKYYKQQQDAIEEKEREINMLIENKNKEVSNVIQERKRSLDEKSKEVSKIVQEKQKEASKMTLALKNMKEDLDNTKKNIAEMEGKNKALEEKHKEINININEKSKEVMRLQKEKKDSQEENILKVSKIRRDSDFEVEEKNKVIQRMNNENRKEVTKISETLVATKTELAVTKEQLTSLQTLQLKFEKNIVIKEQEVVSLKKSVDDTKKKNEFKSNIERSFESLQKQYQMKVDELERLKKQIGNDEKKRRTSNRS